MRPNLLAFGILLVLLVMSPAGLFGYQQWRLHAAGVREIEIVARAPQDGGFAPDHLVLMAGEDVRLRISSPDVVHGFVVPGLGIDVKEILPGRPITIDVTPDKPGRYAFACTRWCGVDHWRMRGSIEVVGGATARAETPSPPLYQQLGIDLDAPHPVAAIVPEVQTGDMRPSASRGGALGAALPADLLDAGRRRTVAPADAFGKLREDPSNSSFTDAQVWDLVAWAWLKGLQPESLELGRALYSRDCAACHGTDGRGDGPAGRNLPGLRGRRPTATGAGPDGAKPVDHMGSAQAPAGPADFTDPAFRLAVSDAFLQGKILRGGMGTGMPEFGSLYSQNELWALVAYIRLFLFQN
jgi:mono/diheme cytochrome c family protein